MNPREDWIEEAKRNAARQAVKVVEDGFVVGLGSGSTAAYAIEEVGVKIKREGLHVLGVPTSYQAFALAVKHGVPVTTMEEHPILDLTVDGADQISKKLDLIKGMGGALAREKIVASSSKKLLIIADETKKVDKLGENDHPIPVEVLPFASSVVALQIRKMGGSPVLREGRGKVGPVITDNGNVIVDVHFGVLDAPHELEGKLKSIPGIVETGLFIGMVDTVFLGKRSGVEAIHRNRV